LKTNPFKYSISVLFLIFLVACSTRNDSFLSRNSHALSTKYNILYNGQLGLVKGVEGIKSQSHDDFWKRLPIERMQIKEELSPESKSKNADFELAEAKATKAIQKHSMNIGGRERNSQIDEAYLLLGKSRYYDQRFIPALDAFNYILYKYPNSSKIYEAKIWREKTNMRLGNDALVVKNMTLMLKEKKLESQVFSDANALLSEAFLNLEEKDSAVAKLRIAEKYTKSNTERARYRFILGQLYEELGKKDSAVYSYESVIEMNRKSERKYVMQAHVRKAQLFDYQKGDTIAFLKTYNKLIADRENRPFLDILFYQMGVFYDTNNKQKQALEFYNSSLKKATSDQYLIASDYRNMGNMYFKNADYPTAAKYYDSTLVKMDLKSREFIHFQKRRKDLDEVILYEAIAKRNDSIIDVVALSNSDRVSYFENYIEKLKKSDELKKIAEDKQKTIQENIVRNNIATAANPAIGPASVSPMRKSALAPPTISDSPGSQGASTFYFYNPSTIAYGKVEFKKNWGNRPMSGNWRLTNSTSILTAQDSISDTKAITENKEATEEIVEQYTADFYLAQLPTEQTAIDSVAKERNYAYYQLGFIYKEKFKEYDLASNKLEQLLLNSPEEKMILPTLYNLYKIYQITNESKAIAMKNKITEQFPNSRYAHLINNTSPEETSTKDTPETEYNKWYNLYKAGEYVTVLNKLDELIIQYSGDSIVSKFELLKANAIGKLKGLTAYKNALQLVADNYPNSDEGKNAVVIIATQIPFLEQMDFNTTDTQNWKILYKVSDRGDKTTKKVEEIIKKYVADDEFKELSYSYDFYTDKESFITIHGIKTEAYANKIIMRMKEEKKYKNEAAAVVISNENYKIIQIKKNLGDYMLPKTK
jgi:tetratricopeptide (TPR) repeat protein